jgi:rare lipoprotein A
MKNLTKYSMFTALVLLSACGGGGPVPKGVKIGKPYNIGGKTYYPAYDAGYNETGIASWYGPGFHGNSTANGERFNTNDLTAAHPTLPMPSLVRVTNLENGKTLVVRINDRGPFADGRIIDLSKTSAKRLGITGLAKVRVQYLPQESEQYIAAVAQGRRIDMFAYNEQLEMDKRSSVLAATAPPEENLIIESTHNQMQPGDTVSSAAPIISVSDADLPGAAPSPKKGGLFVREAYAGEVGKEVVLSSPNIEVGTPRPVVWQTVEKLATPPASGGAGYYVQIGSFSQQANAEKMQQSLSGVTRANMALVEVSGHRWWRLRAGPFSSQDQARAILEQVRSSGAPDARIMSQ